MVLLIAAFLATGAGQSTPYGPADEKGWSRLLQAQCPSHKIYQWISPGVESDLLDEFAAKLPHKQSVTYVGLANVNRVCGVADRWGQSCDVTVKRHALREMGLLGRFAGFACSRAICTDFSECYVPAGALAQISASRPSQIKPPSPSRPHPSAP
jgi:hypothetical protein